MIKRSHIRQFLALVDTGSFTQAADRIRVTQPTLSAGIADLEKRIGSELFVRDRRGVRLTDTGGQFLPVARDLEKRFRLADSFGQATEQDRRILRLGTVRTIGGQFLQTLVARFVRAFDVHLSEGSDYDLRAGMAVGRLDLVLTVLRAHEAGEGIWPLLEEPYMMLAAANHGLVEREQVRPEELASEIMIARRACEALNETSRFFTRKGVRPRFAFKSDNDERCMRMVAAGLGITTAPLSLAFEGIRPIAVEGYDFTRRVGVVLAPHSSADLGLREFLNGAFGEAGWATVSRS